MSKLVSITGVVHTQLSQIWKKEYTNMDALALGYNWHTLATKIAKFTPPKKPTTKPAPAAAVPAKEVAHEVVEATPSVAVEVAK